MFLVFHKYVGVGIIQFLSEGSTQSNTHSGNVRSRSALIRSLNEAGFITDPTGVVFAVRDL